MQYDQGSELIQLRLSNQQCQGYRLRWLYLQSGTNSCSTNKPNLWCSQAKVTTL